MYFEDDYDYLQHLKSPGTALLQPVGLSHDMSPDQRKESEGTAGHHVSSCIIMRKVANFFVIYQASLPEELFGHEVMVEGHLDKVLPVSGTATCIEINFNLCSPKTCPSLPLCPIREVWNT